MNQFPKAACDHLYAYAGVRFLLAPDAWGCRSAIRYYDYYFCRKCLADFVVDLPVSDTVATTPRFGATPLRRPGVSAEPVPDLGS